ncbi:(Fe-S)-binding protein [Methanobrevibacter sp. DSM 116169]|uniref:(Fe-S)-binding protein n=1 Tax=Methanobrevibacter sp. DSM 116169 TaxID=3242727 RepID=UPI0038FC693C
MIYFRGCTARKKDNNISEATEKLLRLAGIDYKVLDDEKCCGSVLLRTGFIDDAKTQMEKNIKDFDGETVITSCAGCHNAFKNDYDDVDAIHISQLIEKLINDNKLNFDKKDIDVSYHDPCHLSRHCNEVDAPRNVIKSVANLKELENNRENTICCGAGGGVKSAFPDISKQIAKSKVEEIKNTNSKYLITTCPFCKLNLNESSPIEVLDITEFLEKVIK